MSKIVFDLLVEHGKLLKDFRELENKAKELYQKLGIYETLRNDKPVEIEIYYIKDGKITTRKTHADGIFFSTSVILSQNKMDVAILSPLEFFYSLDHSYSFERFVFDLIAKRVAEMRVYKEFVENTLKKYEQS